MNRYRTTPGLGPATSKATSTTTCQKCLKKGHYSYECKASVQSRPYASRPSRSQQLQNPRLKPTLTEQKMDNPQDITAGPGLPQKTQKEDSGSLLDAAKEIDSNVAGRKRPRSASASSSASVATISTIESNPRLEDPIPRLSKERSRGGRSRSLSASHSASERNASGAKGAEYNDDQHRRSQPRSPAQSRSRRNHSTYDSDDSSASSVGQFDKKRRQETSVSGYGRRVDHSEKRRRSRSPEVLPDVRRRAQGAKNARQRSLSPYSRRLALTQAMNSGS